MTPKSNGLNIPDYLNKDFFKRSLENELKTNDVEVTSVDLTMGSSPGDNYSSLIYRANVVYKQKDNTPHEVCLIIKSIPRSETHRLINELGFHEKESHIYFDIIPKMQSMLPGTTFGPKCYYTVSEPMNTMVLEDLRVDGFTLGNRQQGLNESECKVVLEKLGRFHAASMRLLEKEPQLLQNSMFKNGFILAKSIDEPLMVAVFFDSFKTEIPIVESWPGYEKYAEKMKKIYSNLREKMLAVVEPTDNELKVLNHGDLWVNNFMFQYSGTNPSEATDVRFLDFQGSYFLSPGIDICYLLNTSVNFEVLKSRRDVLIKDYYYKSLKSTLEFLGHKHIPSLDTIKAEIHRKELYGFITAVAVLPIVCIGESDSTDCSLEVLADADSAGKKRLISCKTKRFEQVMKYILTQADKCGVFD